MKRFIPAIIGLLLIADLGYSFMQHYSMDLDGDLANSVLLTKEVNQLLYDPFGFNVILKNETTINPNRAFVYWFSTGYFRNIPFALQRLVNPLDSIYLSCALIKTGIQAAFIFLIAFCISGFYNPLKKEFLIAALLITPLFQTNGYNPYMGIIDKSISYTFCYALPLILLVLFFLPFFRARKNFEKMGFGLLTRFYLVVLAVLIPFTCPLIPGVVLIICPMILLRLGRLYYRRNPSGSFIQKISSLLKNKEKFTWILFAFVCVLSIYSLFLGQYNTNNLLETVPLPERYSRLPMGLFYQVTQKIGMPLLLFMVFLNAFIIWKNNADSEGKDILILLKWIGIFSLIYILLLPFGGYRIYRPNILRSDTILPITLCLVFIFGYSSYFLLRSLSSSFKYIYYMILAAILLIYTNADKPEFDKNACERDALKTITNSPKKIVFIPSECHVVAWEKKTDPRATRENGELFQFWKITKDAKMYFQH